MYIAKLFSSGTGGFLSHQRRICQYTSLLLYRFFNGIANATISIGNSRIVVNRQGCAIKEGSSKTLKVKSIAKIKIQSKKFTTSNKKIATVSKTGKVTAKKVGKTKIKVKVTFLLSGTAKKNTLSCNVTVKPKKKSASKTTTAPSVKPSTIPVNNASTIPTGKPSAVPDGAASVSPVHTASATSGSRATEPTMTAPSITNTPKPSATPNDPGTTATPIPTNSNTPVSTSTPDNSNETPLPPMPAVTQPPADLRAPGLYSSEDHTTLIKSWDQLISDGDIDTTRNFYDENNVLQYETGIWAKNVYLSGELVIANSVDSISIDAFSGCYTLTSINIPDSVTFISSSAFEECSSLTSVNISKTLPILTSLSLKVLHGLKTSSQRRILLSSTIFLYVVATAPLT